MSNLYTDLEDAIVDRLSAAFGALADVEAMPESEAENTKPFAKPRVTVMYSSSEYAESLVRGLPPANSNSVAYQYEFAEVVVVIRSRLLRGSSGVHVIHKGVTDSLQGYAPEHWSRMLIKVSNYEKNESGVWTWSLTFITRRPFVQAFLDDPTNYPLLEQVGFNIETI